MTLKPDDATDLADIKRSVGCIEQQRRRAACLRRKVYYAKVHDTLIGHKKHDDASQPSPLCYNLNINNPNL